MRRNYVLWVSCVALLLIVSLVLVFCAFGDELKAFAECEYREESSTLVRAEFSSGRWTLHLDDGKVLTVEGWRVCGTLVEGGDVILVYRTCSGSWNLNYWHIYEVVPERVGDA